MSKSERFSFTDRELSRPALDLATRFVQRWDLYAQQLSDGRYICVHQYLNSDHLMAHLRGEITLGVYLLDRESRARYMVLDIDDQKSFDQFRTEARPLAQEGVPIYLEKSRRGGHIWFFFAKPVAGHEARAFGEGILTVNKIKSVEIYPKQNTLVGGPGSLIRLPFGIHSLSNRRYGFLTWDDQPLAPTIREQIDILSSSQTVSKAAFNKYLVLAPQELPKTVYALSGEATGHVSGRIKSRITVLEFISQFVELKPTASGAIGRCPFHDDQHPSLGVNDKGNYWHCFAGCGGGSVIDFWMRLKSCDFTSAVTELASLLLD